MTKKKPARDFAYCAFIDVLGFKEILNDWERAIEFYEEMVVNLFPNVTKITDAVFDAVHNPIISNRKKPSKAKPPEKVSWRIFSDSIILTCKDPYPLIAYVIDLQYFSMLRGYFLRGCIAHGRHFEFKSDSNFLVVSEALRDAYLGESKLAKMPRVIIHPDTLETIESVIFQNGFVNNIPLLSTLMQAEDSHWFVNPFTLPFIGEQLASVFNEKVKIYSDTEHIDKYLWIGDLLNFVTMRHDQDQWGFRKKYYSKDKGYIKYLEDLCSRNKSANKELVHTWKFSDDINTFFVFTVSSINLALMRFENASPFKNTFHDNLRIYFTIISSDTPKEF